MAIPQDIQGPPQVPELAGTWAPGRAADRRPGGEAEAARGPVLPPRNRLEVTRVHSTLQITRISNVCRKGLKNSPHTGLVREAPRAGVHTWTLQNPRDRSHGAGDRKTEEGSLGQGHHLRGG